MIARDVALTALERALGHTFARPELLAQALRHRSAAWEQQAASYERLEFLGDAALSHAVAALLFEHWPDANEGELTRARAVLVRESSLAAIASDLGLGAALEVGCGLEAGSAGPSLLADALEAVLGALLLDGGWQAFRATVRRLVQPTLAGIERSQLALEEPKSTLQEIAQKHGQPLPVYRELEGSGPDHGRRWVFEVIFNGRVLGSGEGPSKRAAQQAAARAALAVLAAETPSFE